MTYWQSKEFTWLLSDTPVYQPLGKILIHNWQRYLIAERYFMKKSAELKTTVPNLGNA